MQSESFLTPDDVAAIAANLVSALALALHKKGLIDQKDFVSELERMVPQLEQQSEEVQFWLSKYAQAFRDALDDRSGGLASEP